MSDKQHILDSLIAHGFRRTSFRIELLQIFIESKHGLSFKDIKGKITSTQDKVTIYRGIDAFLEKGLIHQVPTTGTSPKYAVTASPGSKDASNHQHAHFICQKCNNTFCLEDVDLPELKSIGGFEVNKSKLTLEGHCPNCP